MASYSELKKQYEASKLLNQIPSTPLSQEETDKTNTFYDKILNSLNPKTEEAMYSPLLKNVRDENAIYDQKQSLGMPLSEIASYGEQDEEPRQEQPNRALPNIANTPQDEIKQRQDFTNKSTDMNKLLQDQEMADAYELQRQGMFTAGMGRAGVNLANALAQVKPQTDYFADVEKMANMPVEQVKGTRKAAYEKFKQGNELKEVTEMEDANSDTSKRQVEAAQSLLREQGLNSVAEKLTGLSAKRLMEVLPIYAKAGAARAEKLAKAVQPKKETTLDKEQIKEDVKIRTENRKERRQLDKDLDTWKSLETTIDGAIKKAEDYNKGFGPGTGAYSKLKSFTGALSPETQALETSLNKLSLDQLTKQFSGMSKAIDTPAERAAFESTVPSLGMDNELLISELKARKAAAVAAREKITKGLNRYDRYGRFAEEDSEQVPPSPDINDKVLNFMKKNNITDQNEAIRILKEHGKI